MISKKKKLWDQLKDSSGISKCALLWKRKSFKLYFMFSTSIKRYPNKLHWPLIKKVSCGKNEIKKQG